ncbi:CDP-glycerol glycerophosphotransferase family protein [Bradyrhizobium sp. OAE829]|uniref:CDP-glycerol glycerophosphotransferase family protein n=1 Tax=Bradyrhizobium sp. OAE829 TaxID=2663807 RepID=UPI00178976C9
MLKSVLRWFKRPPSTDILFYAASWVDEVWIRSTIWESRRRGWNVVFAITGPAPATDIARYQAMGVTVVSSIAPLALRTISAPIAVTASSGIPADWFDVATSYRIHMPHSLVSLHMAYPVDAFDGYDVLFAAGPHQIAEFEALARSRNLDGRQSRAIGYGKADVLPASELPGQTGTKPHVLLAPSWGPESLLPRLGRELTRELLKQYRVTLRAHPMQVENQDPAYLEMIETFKGQDFKVELPTELPVSMNEADVFITDYSGTAFEYALMRRRPILFVDVPRKVVNSTWQDLGLAPIELRAREEIGVVVPALAPACAAAAGRLLQDLASWESRIEAALPGIVFRRPSVAKAACDAIEGLGRRGLQPRATVSP